MNNLNTEIANFLKLAQPTADEVRNAVKCLLQIYPARYRALYNTVISHPDPLKFVENITVELQKHFSYLKDDKSREDVVAEDKTIISHLNGFLSDESAPHKGKRADHDMLPDEIRKLWDECSAQYKSIKKLFNTLKAMTDAEPCDRYELVHQLKSGYDRYKENMAKYDEYSAKEDEPLQPADMAKKVSSARAYISKNKDKVIALKADASKVEEFKKKAALLKERVDILIAANADFDRSVLEIFQE